MKAETNHKTRSLSWAALAVALTMAACSSVKLDNEVPVESRDANVAAAGNPSGSTANGGGVPQSSVASVDLTQSGGAGAGVGAAATLGRVVLFDFDSFVVKDEYRPIVEGHAKVLTANKQKQVVIEGHTDERGGREYNLALGQKRAEAVQKSLQLLGVAERQVEAVSYGEERPVADGHDEAAWAKNRRAEIKDR